MDIKKLLEKNKEYTIWKKDIEEQLKIRKASIEDLNSQINFDKIKELGYDKAKSIFEEIKYNLDYKVLRPKFEEVLKDLKEDKYPEMKKAHYFPILNEIDFLTKKQIKNLDNYLYTYPRVRIMNQYYIRMWNECGIHSNIDKIIDFMYKNNMLDKKYILTCYRCSEGDSEEISKEKYDNMKKYFNIESKLKSNISISKEDEEWFEDFDVYIDGFTNIGCECGGVEIEEWCDIEDNLYYEYRLKVKPDTTYENK